VDLEKFDIRHRESWRQEIRQKYQLPADAVVLGFVGRITGDKGVNELFAAFRRLLDACPQTYLMLVGNMEKADSWTRLCMIGQGEKNGLFSAATPMWWSNTWRLWMPISCPAIGRALAA